LTSNLESAWIATKILACQSFGYPNVGQKIYPHFGKVNVRGEQILVSNQIVTKILVAIQAGP